ncbi:MAG: thiS [Xanthomonadaceae bacterium]|nr:thiS [Xanthomonadaceae bacterium]
MGDPFTPCGQPQVGAFRALLPVVRGWDNAVMDIMLNGDRAPLPDQCTIARLLEDSGLAARRVAVEVNGTIVPRGIHATTVLNDGDRVEIVHALGGG